VKARILPLDSDEHRTVQTLLPWYANASLEDVERARVDAHLALCPRCQADVEFQRRLRGATLAEPPGEVERGWLALRARLDTQPAGARRPPARAGWLATRWLPLALGLQTALVLVLATALLTPARQAEYRTLGSAPSALAANALVVFRPDATETEIRRALRACDARLVGGPTVTDAYLLRLPDLGAASLARLRAQRAVARVESLEGEPAK
jgi:anti-sigma factor RsiW